jgi:hypothetical protein
MSKIQELLRDGRDEELWQLCCGFIDLNIDQFMQIQKSLLLEQIELLKQCELGRRIFRGSMPKTIEEFMRQIPLTTYKDYCPDLVEKREDILPAKPVQWIQTLGKGGEYPYKWVPITERYWEEAGIDFGAVALLGSCRKKGDVLINNKMKILYAASGYPYLTNAVAERLVEDIECEFLPSLREAQSLHFEERVNKGFKMALSQGMDGFFGIGAVLVAIGLKFKQNSNKTKKLDMLNQPGALFRLLRGYLKSKKAGRPLMPKDLWTLDYIMSMGTDSMIYKDKIEELWGRKPLHVHGHTESTIIGTQIWDYKDMVFFPNLNFLEFIPVDGFADNSHNKYFPPKTLLLDEVKAGQLYELVITNFHGGALVRYRTGELIRITTLHNDVTGVKLPQMISEGRVDDLIDLSFIRLNERIIWQALENTGIPYKEWTAKKEIGDTQKLHLYLELPKGYDISAEEVADRVYQEIKKIDGGVYVYGDISSIESLIHCKWIVVTIFPEGVFSGYKRIRQEQGAPTVYHKPPHMNVSEKDLTLLENSLSYVAPAQNKVLN